MEYYRGCPVVWKKAVNRYSNKRCLVKLALLSRSRIIIGDESGSYNSNIIKCRADHAKVLGFYSLRGKKLSNNLNVTSIWTSSFQYVVSDIVKPKASFSLDRVSCASGIHFFFTKNAAAHYNN